MAKRKRKTVGRGAGREAYWTKHLAAWKKSGQTITGYCEAEGISRGYFHQWKKKLKGERIAKRRATGRRRPAFVPVEVVDHPGALIEVELRGGRVLRAPMGTAPEILAELVVAVESAGI